ncbi:hypothetical protein [Maricurvus nonylphenolicus]|uniref:hypothetical protein n=1 Tax=Maricurvus nonylphenolicus TaxID=1008307 RepID=UPI0036F19BBE
MKQITLKIYHRLSSVALIISTVLSANTVQAETITVAVNEYCPITCIINQAKPGGLAVDVMEIAFPSPTYTLLYEEMPFMRGLQQTQEGTTTAMATEEEDPNFNLVYPKHFRIHSKACTYTLPNSTWRYNPDDLSSLDEVKIGMVRYYNSQKIEKKLEELGDQVLYLAPGASSIELRMLQMILSGRIDTSFLPNLAADYLIKKNNWQDRLRKSGCGNTLYSETVVFSPSHPKAQFYVDQLDKTYLELVQSGRYAELLEKYGIRQ